MPFLKGNRSAVASAQPALLQAVEIFCLQMERMGMPAAFYSGLGKLCALQVPTTPAHLRRLLAACTDEVDIALRVLRLHRELGFEIHQELFEGVLHVSTTFLANLGSERGNGTLPMKLDTLERSNNLYISS